MKRNLILVSLVVGSVFAGGCNLGSDAEVSPKGPQNQANKQDGPVWVLTLQSQCLEGSSDQCVGFYGFSVDSNGLYIVGPGPEGQVKKGKITPEQFADLDAKVTFSVVAEQCEPIEDLISKDTLKIKRNKKEQLLVRTDESGFCAQIASEKATELHSAIRTLAEEFYALPFPDACDDAIQEVEGMYPVLQKCSKNDDCGYFTPALDIIPPGTLQYVVTDDCSKLKPLVVGNIGAVINSQMSVGRAIEHAQEVCGWRIIRNDCRGTSGFNATDGAPTCVENVCRTAVQVN